MSRNESRKRHKVLSLAQIETKQPGSGTPYAVLVLGGISLYGPDANWLNNSVNRIQKAVEQSASEQLLLVRNQLEKATRERIGEDIGERVLSAVIGRTLRYGALTILPCLTINARILRSYFHKIRLLEINQKLELLDRLITEKTAMSVEAAQSACFPEREWSTKFFAKQLLSHLAYKGRAVFLDEDLFASPFASIKNALGDSHN
jgi:hypothetical protein